MIAAGWRDGVVVAHFPHGARVVHGHFQTLHVHHVAFGVLTDLASGAQGAFGQQVADALALGDHFDHIQ